MWVLYILSFAYLQISFSCGLHPQRMVWQEKHSLMSNFLSQMLDIYFYFSVFTVLRKYRANLTLLKLNQKVWMFLVFFGHLNTIFSKHILSLYDSYTQLLSFANLDIGHLLTNRCFISLNLSSLPLLYMLYFLPVISINFWWSFSVFQL